MSEQKADPRFITLLETQFWITGEYPPKQVLLDHFGFSERDLIEQSRLAESAMKARGLPPLTKYLPPPPVKISNGKKGKTGLLDLDPEFVLACNIICDNVDKRTTAAKLKYLNISTNKWKAMLKVPEQREYFEKRLKESFDDVELSAKLALARNVEAGDLQSVKYFHEYTGRYRPQSDALINLGVVIGRLMEVLAKHLTPEALNEVAQEIEISINETRELTA